MPGLREFPAIPRDLREWNRWQRQAIPDGSVQGSQISDGSITFDKLIDISTDKVLGRASAGTGVVEQLTCTAAGRALIDDADASAQRTTLGLGTAAVVNTGTSGGTVPLLSGSNTHASAKCTLFGIGSVIPVTTQAANADTSGATLGQLETEVNELKAVLRLFGLIAP